MVDARLLYVTAAQSCFLSYGAAASASHTTVIESPLPAVWSLAWRCPGGTQALSSLCASSLVDRCASDDLGGAPPLLGQLSVLARLFHGVRLRARHTPVVVKAVGKAGVPHAARARAEAPHFWSARVRDFLRVPRMLRAQAPHAMRARHALLWAAHVDARGARLGARGAPIAVGVCPALGAVPVVCMACHVLLLVRRRHRRSGGDEARRHRQGEGRLRGWRVEGCGAGDGARVRGSKVGTAAAAADGQGARCGARRLAGPRCTVCTAEE